jgi:hypothetical protein
LAPPRDIQIVTIRFCILVTLKNNVLSGASH